MVCVNCLEFLICVGVLWKYFNGCHRIHSLYVYFSVQILVVNLIFKTEVNISLQQSRKFN